MGSYGDKDPFFRLHSHLSLPLARFPLAANDRFVTAVPPPTGKERLVSKLFELNIVRRRIDTAVVCSVNNTGYRLLCHRSRPESLRDIVRAYECATVRSVGTLSKPSIMPIQCACERLSLVGVAACPIFASWRDGGRLYTI